MLTYAVGFEGERHENWRGWAACQRVMGSSRWRLVRRRGRWVGVILVHGRWAVCFGVRWFRSAR